MNRIGAMRNAHRLENRRALPSAPILIWRRVRLSIVGFGLLCFLSGFAAGQAYAVPAGTLQSIVVCVPGSPSKAPCASGFLPVEMSAYVIDPASASYLDALTTPFDYALGGAFWAFGFAGVMILYFSAHVIGLVLKSVRNG